MNIHIMTSHQTHKCQEQARVYKDSWVTVLQFEICLVSMFLLHGNFWKTQFQLGLVLFSHHCHSNRFTVLPIPILGGMQNMWDECEQAMHYSIDCYVAARLALSASLRLDKRSSFCSAVSAEWEGVVQCISIPYSTTLSHLHTPHVTIISFPGLPHLQLQSVKLQAENAWGRGYLGCQMYASFCGAIY